MAAGWPSNLKFFIEFTAGTWTDVTRDVDLSQAVTIRYGRTGPTTPAQPAQMSLRLSNPKGNYTPGRQVLADGVTAHPYYPNIAPMKRIKVSWNISSTEYPRFIGYIKGWPPTVDNGVRPYVDIAATCIMDRLSRVSLQSTILQEITGDAPSALWPLTDSVGSITALEISGNNLPALTVGSSGAGTPLAFGEVGPGFGDGTGVQFSPATINDGQYLQSTASWLPTFTTTTKYSIEFWFQATTPPAATQALWSWTDGQGNLGDAITIGTGGSIVYFTNTTGGIGNATNFADGAWHHVVATYSASAGSTTLILYVDGVQTGTTSVTATSAGVQAIVMTVGQVSPLRFASSLFVGHIGYVSVYTTALSSTRVAAHAAAGDGYFGDTTGQRIQRVLTFAGLTSAVWNLDTGKALVNTYPQQGKYVLDYAQDMAVTEGGGAVFYTTPDGKARFADRTFRKPAAPVLTIDATKDMSYNGYAPSYDSMILQNQATVYRSSESGTDTTQIATNQTSLDADYDLFSEPLTTYTTTDVDALNNGQDIVASNGLPGFRFPLIPVNLLTAVNNLYVAVASVQIGSRIRLSGIPAGITPATQADAIVEGWTETIQGGAQSVYSIVFDTSPADNPARGIYDDTTYGRYGPGGTATLTSNITSSATSLSITTASGNPAFTTVSARYPLQIQIGQEVIKLNSAPSGSSSPQSFTGVSRAQAGTPAAAQTSGTTIKLFPTATYAL